MMLRLAIVLCVLTCAAGCGNDNRPKDLTKIQPGMGMQRVQNLLGEPVYCETGQGMNVGMTAWHYNEGTVYFYRMSVMKVVKNDAEKQKKLIEKIRTRDNPELPNFSKF